MAKVLVESRGLLRVSHIAGVALTFALSMAPQAGAGVLNIDNKLETFNNYRAVAQRGNEIYTGSQFGGGELFDLNLTPQGAYPFANGASDLAVDDNDLYFIGPDGDVEKQGEAFDIGTFLNDANGLSVITLPSGTKYVATGRDGSNQPALTILDRNTGLEQIVSLPNYMNGVGNFRAGNTDYIMLLPQSETTGYVVDFQDLLAGNYNPLETVNLGAAGGMNDIQFNGNVGQTYSFVGVDNDSIIQGTITFDTVPTPGTTALLGLGGYALAGKRKRNQAYI